MVRRDSIPLQNYSDVFDLSEQSSGVPLLSAWPFRHPRKEHTTWLISFFLGDFALV